jgi:broad specificity phosphatase PhoE
MGTLNLCIVTHGLTLRLFLMRWLQYSVDEFEVRTAQGHTK